jgi:hypothetical protein
MARDKMGCNRLLSAGFKVGSYLVPWDRSLRLATFDDEGVYRR